VQQEARGSVAKERGQEDVGLRGRKMGVSDVAPEWQAWIDQAEHDLAAARSNHENGFWDVAVVLAEQAGEKATKAVWIAKRGVLAPRIHLVGELLRQLGAPEALSKAGTALARGYFAVRYPPVEAPAPFKEVDAGDAEVAIADAERVMKWAKEQLADI